MPYQQRFWQACLDDRLDARHPGLMFRDADPPKLAKQSKRNVREAKLAVSLRENLMRRKAQVRARKDRVAVGQATGQPLVDLEAEGIVDDTEIET